MVNNILILSNEFIEERREVSMVGTRLLYSFIRRVNKEDVTKPIKLPIKEFCKEWGLREESNYSNIIKNIKQLAVAIHERETEKDNGHKVFETGVYFKHLTYDTETKTINASINDMFQTSFVAERGFAKIDFRAVAEINNRYGIRLYELLKQYERFKKRTFNINELKNLLAIEETKYKGRNDLFETKVIKKAISSINDNFPQFNIGCSKEGRAGKTSYTFFFDTMTVSDNFWDKKEVIVKQKNTFTKELEELVDEITFDEFEKMRLEKEREVEEVEKIFERYFNDDLEDIEPPTDWTDEELAYAKEEYEKGNLDYTDFEEPNPEDYY